MRMWLSPGSAESWGVPRSAPQERHLPDHPCPRVPGQCHLFPVIHSALPGLPFQGHTPATQDETSRAVVLTQRWLCPSLNPQGHLAMSGGISSRHTGRVLLSLVGRGWDAAEHFYVHRRAELIAVLQQDCQFITMT